MADSAGLAVVAEAAVATSCCSGKDACGLENWGFAEKADWAIRHLAGRTNLPMDRRLRSSNHRFLNFVTVFYSSRNGLPRLDRFPRHSVLVPLCFSTAVFQHRCVATPVCSSIFVFHVFSFRSCAGHVPRSAATPAALRGTCRDGRDRGSRWPQSVDP